MEASIISATTTDNFSCSKQVFTAEALQSDRLRVECNIYCDARWQDERPAVLILPSFENSHSLDAIHSLVEEGFVACTVDYCGVYDETKTTFPDGLSFAQYPECLNHLDHIETSARNTPWFVWTKIARRAISLLQEQTIVQTDKIGVMGFGIGAQLSYLVAGMDKRVKSLVPINGGGYRWRENNSRFLGSDIPTGDEQIAYSTGVGAETYANFVTCPTLMLATRDAALCDIDRMGDMFDLVKTDAKQMAISVSCCPQITKGIYSSAMKWLRRHLASNLEVASLHPSLHFESADGRLYVKINSDTTATQNLLFVSYGDPCSVQRHWESVDVKQMVGENQFICDIPVYDKEELIVAYATFVYPDGNIMSTRISSATSVMHAVNSIETLHKTSGIMFDCSVHPLKFVAKTSDALLDDDAILLKEGPFGINGVSVEKGSIFLYRSAHEMNSVSRSAILHFDAFSTEEKNLCVNVYTTDLKKYKATTHLQGGEFWQKLLLETTDFKSEEGRPLSAFSNVKAIEFADVDGVVLNNLLWI